MRVALVHDYLTQMGGAERVFELLCLHYPDADIYTSVYDRQLDIEVFKDRTVYTTYLQNVPGGSKYFRLLAPLYFNAFQKLDLSEYDLVISSTTSFAKAVKTSQNASHICLCHNITRFLWDTDTYLRQYRSFRNFSAFLKLIFRHMKRVDLSTAKNPDLYIANSSTVAQRIEHTYGRKGAVINYPVEVDDFIFSDEKEEFYLVSARLISYKRVDVIVEAFNWLGLPLVITGDGPERKYLESRALDNIIFLGHVSDLERAQLMSKSRAVLVAACEDYGLVPIEANASGTPTITYGAGGVLDTQVDGVTGVFFNRQSPEAIQRAVIRAAEIDWDYQYLRNWACSKFSKEVFFKQIDGVIEQVLREPRGSVTSQVDLAQSLEVA